MNYKLYQLPFEENYLHNMEWLPSETDKSYMGDEYQKQIDIYNESEKQVVFKDLHVAYDSDGDEYHSYSWPYEIVFLNHKDDIECFYEDEGIYLTYKGYHFTFPRLAELSPGKFYDACMLFGVPLELTEYGKSLLSFE